MKIIDESNQKNIDYPSEVIFKAIFRNSSHTMIGIKSILSENEIDAEVTSKESSGGKFISYTVKGIFPSDESVQSICKKIQTLEGYMSMF